MTTSLKALLASGALILSTVSGMAATATAVSDLNVRSGPGADYEVLDTLPAGETVRLIGCDGDWCEISMGRDGTGFAAADFLDVAGRPKAARVVIEEDEPEIVGGLVIGGYWENRPYYVRDGYYYWGGRWYGGRPGIGRWRERSFRRWEDRREARLDNRRDNLNDRRGRLDDRRERLDDRRGRLDDRKERLDDRREKLNDRRDGTRDRPEGRDGGRPEGRDGGRVEGRGNGGGRDR